MGRSIPKFLQFCVNDWSMNPTTGTWGFGDIQWMILQLAVVIQDIDTFWVYMSLVPI